MLGAFRAAIAVLLVWALAACSGGSAADSRSSPPLDVAQIIDTSVQADSTDAYRKLRAILVMVDGETVAQRYYDSDATSAWDIESAGKTVVATLIGIALAEKKLGGLDDTLGKLLPDDRRWMSKADAGITLRQILTMTAGLPDDDVFYAEVLDGKDHDWVRTALQLDPFQAPGEGFQYSSAGSHLLSAILVEATGRSVLDYAREKLFDPLGIKTTPAGEPASDDADFEAVYTTAHFAWPTDPQGRHVGGGGLKLTAPDMAKLGLLWLDQGRWGDRQLVPRAWMAEAQSQVVETRQGPASGYGYQQWTMTADGDPAFAAVGRGGQVVEVVPAKRAVVIVLSETQPWELTEPGVAEGSNYLSLIGNLIVPALG